MSDIQNTELDLDARDLQKMGYAQELFRQMGGFSSFAVSFSVISILTGATQLYGYGLTNGGPLQMSLGWGIVSLFTLLVALSMAELASAYPTAGALYHWAHVLGGRTLGWFTACFNAVGQFAILAGIDYGMTVLLVGLLGWEPTRLNLITVYACILLSHAFFNHVGIRVVGWLNAFSAWYHIAVVILLVGALSWAGFTQPMSFLATTHHPENMSFGYSFLIGLLLAQWTMTGYDASAHVTEETVDPRRNAPWGIFLAVSISIVAGWAMLAAVTLSISDLEQAATAGEQAFTFVLRNRLGEAAGTAVVTLVLGAMWLCGLAGMTSASRMVYAFARDGGLPASKVWAKVSPRFRTPANAIWGLAALALVLAVSVSVYSAVVSMATIALYISYGLPIFARVIRRMRGLRDEPGPWSLGRWSQPVAIVASMWVVFICVLFVLPPNEIAGMAMGVVVAALLAMWFLRARHGFRGPKLEQL
jgi:amino acid transporter